MSSASNVGSQGVSPLRIRERYLWLWKTSEITSLTYSPVENTGRRTLITGQVNRNTDLRQEQITRRGNSNEQKGLANFMYLVISQ